MQQDVNTRFPAPFLSRTLKSAAALALAAGLSWTGLPAGAQNLFAPAITVNDDVITQYELEQRARFQAALRVPGDPLETARKELIDDRLKLAVLEQAGLELSDEDVTAGMEELAGRANLSLNDFLTALQQQGVEPQTLRDFTKVGLGWREYTSARFLSRARPTPEEIDRAMGASGTGSVQVLLSEFIVPINEQNAAQVEDLTDQVAQLKGYDSFSAAAAQYSAAASRNDGGRLPWMPLTKLPPQLQEVVLALKPGEISEPLPLQNAVALFQMRGVREVDGAAPRYTAIEYAAYYLPGGRSPETLTAAQKVVDSVDTCDDFYGLAQGQDPSVLDIQSLQPSDIPRDIALELAKLDPNEPSTALTRTEGQTLMVLMLCGRTADLGEDSSRETVANALTAQRMTSLVESYLEQLRADARIDIK
ncbi:MAG: peptidylprolyl isomerase [Leisingera sp.]